jgi:hypothetical protein
VCVSFVSCVCVLWWGGSGANVLNFRFRESELRRLKDVVLTSTNDNKNIHHTILQFLRVNKLEEFNINVILPITFTRLHRTHCFGILPRLKRCTQRRNDRLLW